MVGVLAAKSAAEEEPKDLADAMIGKPVAVSAAAWSGPLLGIGVGSHCAGGYIIGNWYLETVDNQDCHFTKRSGDLKKKMR